MTSEELAAWLDEFHEPEFDELAALLRSQSARLKEMEAALEEAKDLLWLREAELGLVGDPALIVAGQGPRSSVFKVVDAPASKFVPPPLPELRARRLAWEARLTLKAATPP